MVHIFFAYAAEPESTSETVSLAAQGLHGHQDVSATTWQDLHVAGRLVLTQITDAITQADLLCCDLSTLNSNVLFELGFAIARGKPVWVLLDSTDEDAKRRWNAFGLLGSVGYVGYKNSADIRSRILGGLSQLRPLWDDVASPNLPIELARSVFYMPLNHATEASRTLTRRLESAARNNWHVTVADASEIGAAPLSWYLHHVLAANASVIHFSAPRRANSVVHNARCALIAGIAYGLGKQVLMLAEEQYESPFDYQDILQLHASSKQLAQIFDGWLPTLSDRKVQPAINPIVRRAELKTALQQLNFYEYVAEQESETLEEYFVRTREFDSVLTSRSVLFVGRKGVGKTANMLQAANTLCEDRRNVVCIIKPVDYELKGLIEVLRRYQGRESRSYLVENMWKLLLYSEIAKTLIENAEALPAGIGPTGPLAELRDYVDTSVPGVRDDFALRLEKIVEQLLRSAEHAGESIAQARDTIGASLGGVIVRDLRKRLESAVTPYNRVAILVDNLDKAWDKQADLNDLSQLLLGLLTAVGRVAGEFRRTRGAHDEISFSLALFLRHDIYQHLVRVAREPDKIRASIISWSNPDFLFRVIDERFINSRGQSAQPDELWTRFFCRTINEYPTRDYLFNRILPRPRDLLFLVNTALANAVNGAHEQVMASDIRQAEKTYSRFAFEAALVANGITSDKLEELLYEFAGAHAIVTMGDITEALATVKIPAEKLTEVVEHLLSLEFIGREIREGYFAYGSEGPEAKLNKVLARKLADTRGGVARFKIHPAFCPYLEVIEDNE